MVTFFIVGPQKFWLPLKDPYVRYEEETRIIDELNGHQGLIDQIKGYLSLLIICTVCTPGE